METMEKKELKKYLKTQIELTSDHLKKIEEDLNSPHTPSEAGVHLCSALSFHNGYKRALEKMAFILDIDLK